MAVDSKPNTISAPEEIATSDRARRLRWTFAVLNLVLVPLLLILFIAVVESRRIEPMYSWIEGTPLATTGERVGRLFSRRAYQLAGGIGADKAKHAEALIDQMTAATPTHVAVTVDRETIFGQIASRSDEAITFHRLDGKISQPRTVAQHELVMLKTIALPDVVLAERDVDFLLSTPDVLHVCLPPLLVATTEGYGQAYNLHLTLSLLEEAFRLEFAPLVNDGDTSGTLIHVVQSPLGAMAASAQMASEDAWYDSLTKRLVVRSRLSDTDFDRLVRHEGAHELSDRLGVFGSYETTPLWLREGVAQYCETSPLGGGTPERNRQLIDSLPRFQGWEQLVSPKSIDQLSDDVKRSDFYAQSWFLVAWMMAPSRRAAFFRWIATVEQTGQPSESSVGIMNAAGVTASQLSEDLRKYCESQRSKVR